MAKENIFRKEPQSRILLHGFLTFNFYTKASTVQLHFIMVYMANCPILPYNGHCNRSLLFSLPSFYNPIAEWCTILAHQHVRVFLPTRRGELQCFCNKRIGTESVRGYLVGHGSGGKMNRKARERRLSPIQKEGLTKERPKLQGTKAQIGGHDKIMGH